MNFIFDLGEQLAELPANIPQGDFNQTLGLHMLERRHWMSFLVEDARECLKEKVFGGMNDRAKRMAKLLRQLASDCGEEDLAKFFKLAIEASEEEPVIMERNGDGVVTSEPLSAPAQYMEDLDDLLDDVFYEIGAEIQEFVNGFYVKGDLWSVDATPNSNHMVFTFCCRRSAVEAAVLASGGKMRDFVQHLIG